MSDIKTKSYFAASNSFGGFTSLFDSIFHPHKFDRLFILKGGPGTGKSTLMKRLIEYAVDRNLYAESVYCSSDPNSLDGVIIEGRDKRIGVIDGTSPHSEDPKYPGSIDSIIDLGSGFDIAKLKNRRSDIIKLTEMKKDAYSDAYTYLSSAGRIFQNIFDKLKMNFNSRLFLDEIGEYIDYAAREVENPPRYYITSFGKDGIRRVHVNTSTRTVSVLGDGVSEFVAMDVLASHVIPLKAAEALCPHPFSATLYDAIFTSNATFITNFDNADFSVCTNEYCHAGGCDEDAIDEYKRLLSLSAKAFRRASINHFMLEEIYKESISFENNDRILKSLTSQLDEILLI